MTGPDAAGRSWPAPAKINLMLRILGRRADGYHLLQTLCQLLDFGDRLRFSPRPDRELRLSGNSPAAGNLALRAAEALRQNANIDAGADIHIDKKIPLGAGLGGGSSNAATTLVALNRLWRTGCDTDELARLGLGLGADVPLFVRGQTAWVEGIGERLRPLRTPVRFFAVVHCGEALSTAEVFKHPQLPRHGQALGSPEDWHRLRGHNDCLAISCMLCPPIAEALRWMQSQDGLEYAGMSGSGAAVFGCFAEREAADQASEAAKTAGEGWICFAAAGCQGSPLYNTCSNALGRRQVV